MVPKVGFEPTRDCSHQILSLACIPISPLGHKNNSIKKLPNIDLREPLKIIYG